MGRITQSIGAQQNIGQAVVSCDSGARKWNTVRYAKTGTLIQFRARDISFASGQQWYKAILQLWLLDSSGNIYNTATSTRLWGQGAPAWSVLTPTWVLGGFRIMSKASLIYKDKAGRPAYCAWGSWKADLNYDNTH